MTLDSEAGYGIRVRPGPESRGGSTPRSGPVQDPGFDADTLVSSLAALVLAAPDPDELPAA
jgi:hypothetical protein